MSCDAMAFTALAHPFLIKRISVSSSVWLVLLVRTRMSKAPGISLDSRMSCHCRATSSDTRKPAWNNSPITAWSTSPLAVAFSVFSRYLPPRPVGRGSQARAIIIATSSTVSGSDWPRPRLKCSRRILLTAASALRPRGDCQLLVFSRNTAAAINCSIVAGLFHLLPTPGQTQPWPYRQAVPGSRLLAIRQCACSAWHRLLMLIC